MHTFLPRPYPVDLLPGIHTSNCLEEKEPQAKTHSNLLCVRGSEGEDQFVGAQDVGCKYGIAGGLVTASYKGHAQAVLEPVCRQEQGGRIPREYGVWRQANTHSQHSPHRGGCLSLKIEVQSYVLHVLHTLQIHSVFEPLAQRVCRIPTFCRCWWHPCSRTPLSGTSARLPCLTWDYASGTAWHQSNGRK